MLCPVTQGMQFNPGQKTLESELEAALVKAGGISTDNAGTPSKACTLLALSTGSNTEQVGQTI